MGKDDYRSCHLNNNCVGLRDDAVPYHRQGYTLIDFRQASGVST